jgi:hypothetical protein
MARQVLLAMRPPKIKSGVCHLNQSRHRLARFAQAQARCDATLLANWLVQSLLFSNQGKRKVQVARFSNLPRLRTSRTLERISRHLRRGNADFMHVVRRENSLQNGEGAFRQARRGTPQNAGNARHLRQQRFAELAVKEREFRFS